MKIQDQKLPSRSRARFFQVYVLLAAVAFGILFFFARTAPYFTFDVPIARAVQSISWNWFAQLMVLLTQLGEDPVSYIWCGAIILFMFLIGLRWEAVMSACAAIGVSLLGAGVKLVVQRARPGADLVNVFSVIDGYSFPSGHVLFFTGFLGFLIFLLYTLAPRTWWRTTAILLLAVPITLISVSRVYLGQHWPSDTLGAYLLASLWLALMIFIYRWGKRKRFFESGK